MLMKKSFTSFSTPFLLSPHVINHWSLLNCLIANYLQGLQKCVSVSSFNAWLCCALHQHHEELLANQFHFQLRPINKDPLVNSQRSLQDDHLIWNWGYTLWLLNFLCWMTILNFPFFFFFNPYCTVLFKHIHFFPLEHSSVIRLKCSYRLISIMRKISFTV